MQRRKVKRNSRGPGVGGGTAMHGALSNGSRFSSDFFTASPWTAAWCETHSCRRCTTLESEWQTKCHTTEEVTGPARSNHILLSVFFPDRLPRGAKHSSAAQDSGRNILTIQFILCAHLCLPWNTIPHPKPLHQCLKTKVSFNSSVGHFYY